MKKAARNKKESFVEKVDEVIAEAVVPDTVEQKKVKKFFKNKPIFIGSAIVILIVLAAGAFYLFLYFQKDATPTNAQLTSTQIKELVNDVGKLVVLPEGETPTIATVTDVEKLSDQPFFRTAQNGDKVLLYGSTKEAILYRPSIGKIIRIAPVNETNIASPSPTLAPNVSGTPAVTPQTTKIKVVILNSTQEAGLARKASALLDKEKFDVISTSNAVKEYESTMISKISGNNATDAVLKAISASFGSIKAQIKTYPSDEATQPDAEVVIILGTDFADKY